MEEKGRKNTRKKERKKGTRKEGGKRTRNRLKKRDAKMNTRRKKGDTIHIKQPVPLPLSAWDSPLLRLSSSSTVTTIRGFRVFRAESKACFVKKLREEFNLPAGIMISVTDAYTIIHNCFIAEILISDVFMPRCFSVRSTVRTVFTDSLVSA